MVAVNGWVDVSDVSAFDLAKKLAAGGVKTFIFTDIDTDGMLSGVNLVSQKKMLDILLPVGAKLIASGGVASPKDIEDLNLLSREYRNLDGVIVGKAIYEKRVNLSEIIKMVEI